MPDIDFEPGKGYRRREPRAEPGQPMLLNGGKEKLLVAVIVFLVLIIASIALAPVHAYLYNGPFMSLWCWLFGC